MKKYSTVLGLAIGDALGQPFEFGSPESISDWDGKYSSYGHQESLGPGQWTDDTQMALALAESLIAVGDFEMDHVAQKYIDWVESGDVRGIGTKTANSISKLAQGVSPLKSGGEDKKSKRPSFKRVAQDGEVDDTGLHGIGNFCGCGTVMRCAPIGLFYHSEEVNYGEMEYAAKTDATMTHNHPDARDSSVFLCRLIAEIINNTENITPIELCEKVTKFADFESTHVVDTVKEAIELAKDPYSLLTGGIALGFRGTAHETLASAIFCFLKYPSFEESVRSAVLILGDADSRAAITGALAGTYYGISGIPRWMIDGVERSEYLQKVDEDLYKGLRVVKI